MPAKWLRKPVLPPRLRFCSMRWKKLLIIAAAAALLLAVLIPSDKYFRELSGAMACSNAEDLITQVVNDIVWEKMSDPALTYDYFVELERNYDGDVTAVVTNMARINKLSSELLSAVVNASDCGDLELRIPLGDLLGSNLLLGRGPRVPVRITMLTSSRADFSNELISAGINQTKHQVLLTLHVYISVLLPWEVVETESVCSVPVAETIIVGDVPDTYLNWEKNDG